MAISIRISWLFLICSLVMLVSCNSLSKPEKVAERFYQLIAAGKTDPALDMFDFKGVEDDELTFVRGKMTAGIGEIESRIKSAGGLKSVEIVSIEIEGDKARVEVKLHLADGSQQSDHLRMIRDGNAWKIALK